MKRILLLLLVCLPLLASGQNRRIRMANEETAAWRYELESISVGNMPGTIVVKVWSYSKKPNVAAEQAKKNAVHGAVFKGIPARDRVPGKQPLVTDENAQADFFDSFFADGGDYMRFVTLTNTGDLGGGDVLKISNKEYKVGVLVMLNYNQLRSALEEKGIVRALNSGF